ncbi:MAG: hypothetical protein EPO54_12745 [Brevundimonas sp.]|nr:MAG: hypothetical protein EPO54_12745 [Brevundimonas sp.]
MSARYWLGLLQFELRLGWRNNRKGLRAALTGVYGGTDIPLTEHNRCALDDDRALASGRASGYDRLVAEKPGYVNAHTVSLNIPFAAGAMRSTVVDLLIWSQALSHGQVLKDDSYRQMLTAARLNDGARASYTDENGDHPIDYALGIGVTETLAGPVVSHDGAIDGFTSSLTIFTGPDLAVAILVNTSPSAHLPFDDVMEAIRGDPAVSVR